MHFEGKMYQKILNSCCHGNEVMQIMSLNMRRIMYLTHYAPTKNLCASMFQINLKWWHSEVASTNSSNSLCFLLVEMDNMSDGINGNVNNEDCGTFFDTIWGSLQVRLVEEDQKISGHMQLSRYHSIPAHTSRQWCQTIEGSLAVPWPVSNRLSVSSATVYSWGEKVHNLVQSSVLDLSLRGWPGEMVNWPKCSHRTTRLVLKGSLPLSILVATEGP